MFTSRTYAYSNSYRFGDTRTYPNCHARTGPHSHAGVHYNGYTSSLCHSDDCTYSARSKFDPCEYPNR